MICLHLAEPLKIAANIAPTEFSLKNLCITSGGTWDSDKPQPCIFGKWTDLNANLAKTVVFDEDEQRCVTRERACINSGGVWNDKYRLKCRCPRNMEYDHNLNVKGCRCASTITRMAGRVAGLLSKPIFDRKRRECIPTEQSACEDSGGSWQDNVGFFGECKCRYGLKVNSETNRCCPKYQRIISGKCAYDPLKLHRECTDTGKKLIDATISINRITDVICQ